MFSKAGGFRNRTAPYFSRESAHAAGGARQTSGHRYFLGNQRVFQSSPPEKRFRPSGRLHFQCIARLKPHLIANNACGSSRYWARNLSEVGHTVRGRATGCEPVCEGEQKRGGQPSKHVPGNVRQLLTRLGEHLKAEDKQVGELEWKIQRWEGEAMRQAANWRKFQVLT